jgi:hypothetical protein
MYSTRDPLPGTFELQKPDFRRPPLGFWLRWNALLVMRKCHCNWQTSQIGLMSERRRERHGLMIVIIAVFVDDTPSS